MKISKLIKMTILVIITSLYYFPIQFRVLPSLNTKMALAALGIVIFALNCIKRRKVSIEKDTLYITILAALVSLCGLMSVVINKTADMSYVTYIVSYLVWLFGAYCVIDCIRIVHSKVSVWLVVEYLMVVSVIQCASALMIDLIPSFGQFVNRWLFGFGFTDLDNVLKLDRMYGIGAALDVAGARFCPILVGIAAMIVASKGTTREKNIWIYITCFIFITVVGSMIGRTTSIGAIIGLIVLFIPWYNRITSIKQDYLHRLGTMVLLITLVSGIFIFLYKTNPFIHEKLRFAFEGFFSLAETGEWQVSSNERLKNMVIFPESLKTWIIGDGYFEGAANDMNYIGDSRMTSFYMWTDIGYLRFIFYFGLLGLTAFITYFIKCAFCCIRRFKKCSLVFLLALLMNFIIWFKVSTDIFLFFALFLCIYRDEHEEYEVTKLLPDLSDQ